MGTNFYKIYFTCGYWIFEVKHRVIIFESKLLNVIGYDKYIRLFKYNPLSKYNNHKNSSSNN